MIPPWETNAYPRSLGGAECQTPSLATQTTKVGRRRDDPEVLIRPTSPYESDHHKGGLDDTLDYIYWVKKNQNPSEIARGDSTRNHIIESQIMAKTLAR